MKTLFIVFVVLGAFSHCEGLAFGKNNLVERISAEHKDTYDFPEEIKQHIYKREQPKKIGEMESNQGEEIRVRDVSVRPEGSLASALAEWIRMDNMNMTRITEDLLKVANVFLPDIKQIADIGYNTNQDDSVDDSQERKRPQFWQRLFYRSQDVTDTGVCAFKSFEILAKCVVKSYPSIYSLLNIDNLKSGGEEEPKFVEEGHWDREHVLQEHAKGQELPPHFSCLTEAMKYYELCSNHEDSGVTSRDMHDTAPRFLANWIYRISDSIGGMLASGLEWINPRIISENQ